MAVYASEVVCINFNWLLCWPFTWLLLLHCSSVVQCSLNDLSIHFMSSVLADCRRQHTAFQYMGLLYFVTTQNTKNKVRFSSLPLVITSTICLSVSSQHWDVDKQTPKVTWFFFVFICFHLLSLPTDANTGTPAISTTTTVEIRKSSVMTTEITSKVEKIPTTATSSSTCPSVETEEEKAKRLLYCSLCKVAVNSASQLEAHNSGEMEQCFLFFSSVSRALQLSSSE